MPAQLPRITYAGSPVSENASSRQFVNRGRPGSLLDLLYLLLAIKDFHQRRRNICVVEHHFPFPLFMPVDVRHPPIYAYRLVSELRLAMFAAQGVGHILG